MEGRDGTLLARLATPWPLTARATEVEALVSALEGGSPAVYLLGEPGCGKTRLASEAAAELARRGWATSAAAGAEATRHTPLGALAHLVPSDAARSPHAAIAIAREALVADERARQLQES